jgi:RNA polymerase sigma-70 factor (ECF subfamily)
MKALYAALSAPLSGICSRYIKDPDRRKDVLQESFIKIFTRIGMFTYRGEGSLRAWATRITVNEALGEIRKESRSPFERMTEATEKTAQNVEEESEADVDLLTGKELASMIAELPAGYRAVFNLYAVEGLGHKEIGKILGIKPDTSASQYHRARAMLSKMIREYLKKKGK